jgi:CheY-like chemotaxis protein/anti-sigma regulatory factor (Ser/Thr protein kinase)
LNAKPHHLRGDAIRLQQVFWNVLKNAAKFTPKNGKISVETSVTNKGGQLNVKITDTGIGMTDEELNRVFKAFSQGDHVASGAHRFGGLGLGLAISKQLVELHSGHIHASSDGRNQGACLIIELPFAKMESENAPPLKSSSKNPSAKQKSKGAGAKILLVEDHEPTRNTLTALLLRRQYKIFAAASLAEARKIAGEEKIDLVISDIGLPDGSGYALMSELRDGFGLKGIALTGYGMEHDIEQAQTAGFVAHVTKPVRMELLEQVLGEAL